MSVVRHCSIAHTSVGGADVAHGAYDVCTSAVVIVGVEDDVLVREVTGGLTAFARRFGGSEGGVYTVVVRFFARFLKNSIAIGSTETNTMPMATSEKLSLTIGTLPKI